VLWAKGERDAACEQLFRALRLEPGYTWAWQQLRRWLGQLGRPDDTIALAREIAHDRGGEAAAWLAVTRELQGTEQTAERLAALDRAMALQRSVEPMTVEGCEILQLLSVLRSRDLAQCVLCDLPNGHRWGLRMLPPS